MGYIRENYYTVKEAAAIEGVSIQAITLRIRKNLLKAEKIAETYFIEKKELEQYRQIRGRA